MRQHRLPGKSKSFSKHASQEGPIVDYLKYWNYSNQFFFEPSMSSCPSPGNTCNRAAGRLPAGLPAAFGAAVPTAGCPRLRAGVPPAVARRLWRRAVYRPDSCSGPGVAGLRPKIGHRFGALPGAARDGAVSTSDGDGPKVVPATGALEFYRNSVGVKRVDGVE